jgi:hypothetical protein
MGPVRKPWIAVSAAALAGSMLLWAKQPEPIPGVPGVRRPEPEEQARELLQAADANLPKFVRVQVEFIELPHEALTELLYMNNPEEADAGAMRELVQEAIQKGEASVLETLVCTARSGEKALVEAVDEVIYPTEYEPFQVPSEVKVAVGDKEQSPDLPALERLVAPPTPTSFETRNVGGTLEIEPTIGANGKIIDLRLAPDLTWHTGESVWLERRDSLGNVTKVQMPNFYTIRMVTALTCLNGQYLMPAVVSPKGDAGASDRGRKVMIFVKCNVLTVK